MNFECIAQGLLLAEEPPGGINGLIPFMWLIPVIILYVFLIQRPQCRQQAQQEMMLKNIKKNDRVITTSGIYGVVTNVQSDADEVTIKVDESNNTKLRMTLSAVARRGQRRQRRERIEIAARGYTPLAFPIPTPLTGFSSRRLIDVGASNFFTIRRAQHRGCGPGATDVGRRPIGRHAPGRPHAGLVAGEERSTGSSQSAGSSEPAGARASRQPVSR